MTVVTKMHEPTLVEAEVNACTPLLAVNKTACVCIDSGNEQSSSFDHDTTNNNLNALPIVPPKQTEEVMVVPSAVVKEAQHVAQSIRVTQAVFQQHGLDSNIATEWAK